MKELLKFLDREAYVSVGTMKVTVRIVDIKMNYGKIRFVVEPLNGSGTLTCEQERLELL